MVWHFHSSLLSTRRAFLWRCIPRSRRGRHHAKILQAIAWLRRRVPADEIVYRKQSAVIAYDHVGGLAVPWYDGLTDTFGFSPQRMERRRRLLIQPSRDPDAYEAERIRWFVLGPSDTLLSRYAEEWMERGRAREELRFGSLRIIKLLPRQVP